MSIPPPPYSPGPRHVAAHPALFPLAIIAGVLGVVTIVLAWLLLSTRLEIATARLEAAQARAEVARLQLETERRMAEMTAAIHADHPHAAPAPAPVP